MAPYHISLIIRHLVLLAFDIVVLKLQGPLVHSHLHGKSMKTNIVKRSVLMLGPGDLGKINLLANEQGWAGTV